MRRRIVGALMMALCLLGTQAAQAGGIKHPVEDRVEALSAPSREALAARLVALRELTGVSAAVVIEEPAEGTPLEDASWAALRTWSPVATERGVVLYVAPAARRWRLEVGWGVEVALGPAAASALLARGQGALTAGQLDAALLTALDGLGESLAKGRYQPAAQPPLIAPTDDMGFPLASPTEHALTSWSDPGEGTLTLGTGRRAGLPGERWVEELTSTKRIHDHARALSPSWEAAMTRKLASMSRDRSILVTLVTIEPGERSGESLARHAERLMRRWLQLQPGGERVMVLLEPEPTPRMELRTGLGLSRLYTPLRVEGIIQDGLAVSGQGGHLERVLDRVVQLLDEMASKREALEAGEPDAAKPALEAPAPVEERSEGGLLRVLLMVMVAGAMLALCGLCVWVAWTLRKRR
jgi:uncharacterized membrane protein YgcG